MATGPTTDDAVWREKKPPPPPMPPPSLPTRADPAAETAPAMDATVDPAVVAAQPTLPSHLSM